MFGEAKKLHLIEEILKVESDVVLTELEAVLSNFNQQKQTRRSFKEFVGNITTEDINELEQIIEDGCEQINENDWK